MIERQVEKMNKTHKGFHDSYKNTSSRKTLGASSNKNREGSKSPVRLVDVMRQQKSPDKRPISQPGALRKIKRIY